MCHPAMCRSSRSLSRTLSTQSISVPVVYSTSTRHSQQHDAPYAQPPLLHVAPPPFPAQTTSGRAASSSTQRAAVYMAREPQTPQHPPHYVLHSHAQPPPPPHLHAVAQHPHPSQSSPMPQHKGAAPTSPTMFYVAHRDASPPGAAPQVLASPPPTQSPMHPVVYQYYAMPPPRPPPSYPLYYSYPYGMPAPHYAPHPQPYACTAPMRAQDSVDPRSRSGTQPPIDATPRPPEPDPPAPAWGVPSGPGASSCSASRHPHAPPPPFAPRAPDPAPSKRPVVRSEYRATTHGAGSRLRGVEKPVAPSRRKRLRWTEDLHEKFVRAIDEIGVHSAVPKALMQSMKVPGLTRENIASHLQKYRQRLKERAANASSAAPPAPIRRGEASASSDSASQQRDRTSA